MKLVCFCATCGVGLGWAGDVAFSSLGFGDSGVDGGSVRFGFPCGCLCVLWLVGWWLVVARG